MKDFVYVENAGERSFVYVIDQGVAIDVNNVRFYRSDNHFSC